MKKQLQIVVGTTYGLNPYQYFQKQNLKFLGRSLVTKRFSFHSNFRSVYEIKGLPISIDFQI